MLSKQTTLEPIDFDCMEEKPLRLFLKKKIYI